MAKNTIISKPSTPEYRKGWERIFENDTQQTEEGKEDDKDNQ